MAWILSPPRQNGNAAPASPLATNRWHGWKTCSATGRRGSGTASAAGRSTGALTAGSRCRWDRTACGAPAAWRRGHGGSTSPALSPYGATGRTCTPSPASSSGQPLRHVGGTVRPIPCTCGADGAAPCGPTCDGTASGAGAAVRTFGDRRSRRASEKSGYGPPTPSGLRGWWADVSVDQYGIRRMGTVATRWIRYPANGYRSNGVDTRYPQADTRYPRRGYVVVG